MPDLLTARLASAKPRARARMSTAEREAVQASREASRAALARAIESRNAAHYERTVARMQSLMTERAYALEDLAREREAGRCWIVAGTPIGERLARIDAELAVVFGTPIRQSDIAPGGRYERFVMYHFRRIASRITHGSMLMTGDDSRDILSLAIVRAYTESALVEDERGQMVPTIGILYRFGRAELVRAVSRARKEVATSSRDAEWHSERSEMPRVGVDSLVGVDPASLPWDAILIGDASARDRDRIRSILTPPPRWAVPPTAEESALADRVNRRIAARERVEHERHSSARREDRASVAATATFGNDDALGIDAACVSLISDGSSLDDVAARLSVKRETIVRRLGSVRFRDGRAVRIGSDGRGTVKRSGKRAQARDVRTPDERELIVTRKRVVAVRPVVPFVDSVRPGMVLAEPPAHTVHYGADAIAEVTVWTCDACGMTHDASAYATLTGHTLAGCKRDGGTERFAIAEVSPQGEPVAMSAHERHAAAHNMSRCNCDMLASA